MLSKLDAVNRMLDAIGESPVNSLESGLGDAENAERILDNTNMDVQQKGWYANTERGVTLSRSISGEIFLPNNTLKVDTVGIDKSRQVVKRKNRLYDLDNKTYIFNKSLSCDIVYQLAWDELTYTLQRYITAMAARTFQRVSPTSTSLDQMIREELTEAWADLLDEESETADTNILNSNPFSFYMSHRNSRMRDA
ncbi:hypothetical protein [Roseibium alexandrii]|uniref:Uncharacterized protein n=1 Tax=Roseibium alexandrii (strain DSM 17067 / NCIMB 14079 / DFL-11) TaxID=244592 RepID=A0A5E8GSZ5_ROSAD|nr:hypothetical protein [Roseibium alexandrii]EEE42834.2 hypothetical protein SADFL11_PLAS6 [Roseibium alexandrii DFL-11]